MNPHLRMEKILAVIEANPGITGQKIADICAVPWGVIQKDLETMSLATENPIPLYTDTDAENLLDDELEANSTPESKWFLDTYTRKQYSSSSNSGRSSPGAGLDLCRCQTSKAALFKTKGLRQPKLRLPGNIPVYQGQYGPRERYQ